MKKWLSLLLGCATLVAHAQQGERFVQDISAYNWKLWLDTAAQWKNDVLYAPPVDIRNLPVTPPTGGWDKLQQAKGITVHLPATVEEYYWGKNGNSFGVSGNYLGVSWFTTQLTVPATLQNKRIILHFESARFRAEVFVNRKLAGYDLVNGTPFDVDITHGVVYGKANEIAVRITDPNGNFDWRDSQNFMWGNYRTNPTHGFGGITGKVTLLATEDVYIRDVFVKNKPQINEVDAEIEMRNAGTAVISGNVLLQVKEVRSGKMVYSEEYPVNNLSSGDYTQSATIRVRGAALWSVDSPNLYIMSAIWKGKNNATDIVQRRFGFRWFEIRDVAGDKQFYLNGKRIVLRTSISWGFWPGNGIAPSDELATKQVMDAKRLGLNMLNFHRTIGQTNVLDKADELGLLYFEEPGGNQYPATLFDATDPLGNMQTDFYLATRTEKLLRMIRRDRSHPSLVIYNMHNERGALPAPQDRQEMHAGHALDETRIMTYNSCNGDIKTNEPDPKYKLHLLPYDTAFHDYGWWDQHHAGGPGVYHDNLYNGPTRYAKYTDHANEIIYWGEEGAIGTPPRLQLIREEILKRGAQFGWESDAYLKWYDAYNTFLQKNGYASAFPNVDSLTRQMGNTAYYYQGRMIENIRMGNITDGYAVNGWESMKLENHSGIVDNYRNPKGDAALIARYNQPLYVAVKLNHKVLSVGETTIADFFLVNEKDVHGSYQLNILAKNDKGATVWSQSMPVTVKGGSTYGQLLSATHPFSPKTPGYTTIEANLSAGDRIIASGSDELYAVQPDTTGISTEGMIADTSGALAGYLQHVGISALPEFKSGRPKGKYLLVGAFEPQQTGNPLVTDILEWVNEGNTLIVVDNIEHWADHLARKEVIDYRGTKVLGTTWYGGNYFSRQHPLFNGLPQACVFNWEYQCFATYNKKRIGLRLFNGDPVVACVADHKPEVYSALSIVPHGNGRIILCALDILSCIKDVKTERKAEGDGENAAMNTFNTSQKNTANVVGQQLLLNMIKYASVIP